MLTPANPLYIILRASPNNVILNTQEGGLNMGDMRGKALYWEPLKPIHYINHCYDDKVIDAFKAFFESFPVIISRDHLPALRAMQRIGGGRPLQEVIDAVEKEGEIRLWWDSSDWRRVSENERSAVLDRERPFTV